MKKLLLILYTFSFPYFSFSQGSFTQTTTTDFNNNVNFNISTLNDELKLICDKGTGAQGDLNVLVGNSMVIDSPRTSVTGNNIAGQYYINVASTAGFSINDEVLIITSLHGSVERAGQYEFRRIQNKTSTILYFTDPLRNTYDAGNTHQVVRVPNYNNVTIAGTLTCSPWNGQTGGILVFRATGLVKVTSTGNITVDTMGYRYGTQYLGVGSDGEGILGNGGHGGSIPYARCQFPRNGGWGGGGGHRQVGTSGQYVCAFSGGEGGNAIGDSLLSKIFFGGAGGGGGCGSADPYGCTDIGAKGGRGAGIIYIACDSLSIESYISSNGQLGGSPVGTFGGGGGRGAGGTIYIISQKNIIIGNDLIIALSHSAYPFLNAHGRIRIDAPGITGTSNPNYGYTAINYAYYGYSISPVITKPSNNGWLTLTFNVDTSLAETSVRFDVLNTSDSVLLSNLQSGSNLNDLGLSQSINSVKFKARLTNTNGDRTPILYDWTINWGASVPSQPVLMSPTNGSIDISLTPLLDWGDVTTATNYRLQVSNNSGFTTNIINDSSLTSSQYTISSGLLNYNTTYYWRVSAKNSLGWSVYSSVFNFTTFLHVPGAPALILPANGATGQPTTVTFKWNKAVETLLKSIIQGDNKRFLKNEMNGPLTIGNYWFEYGTDSTFATVIARDSSLTDTTKTLSGLSNITRYFWRVKAKNQAGWSNFSTIWNFTTVVPVPAAPTLLTPANNTIDVALTPALDWNDVTYAASYRVQVSLDSLFGTTAFDSSGISFSNITVPSGKLTTLKKYYWRVNATNISGTSAYSTVWSFTTAPNAPNLPVLSLPSNGATGQPTTVIFKWYKAVETFLGLFIKNEKKIKFKNESDEPLTISKYWFEYGTDSTLSTVLARDSSLTDTTKTITGLSNITKYYWRVKAKNQTGWGNFSSIWNFTTIVPIPAAPVLVSPATGSFDISLTPVLDWNDVSYAASYRTQISTDSLFTTILYDTAGLTVSQIMVPPGKLTTKTKYYWRTNATNISGTSLYSTIWSFTTAPNAPNIPLLSLPANGATGQPTTITFKWYKAVETLLGSFMKKEKKTKIRNGTDELLTISNYWFEYGTDSTLSTVIARDSSLSDTTKAISGLSNITKYYWRVKAKNQTGWGGFSAIWNFTTIVPVPAAPVLISPATGSFDISLTPALDWSDVTYASGYRLQISLDSLFGVTAFDSSGITVSNITIPSGKLTTLKKYYWRVNATNIAGTGVWSSVWNFTTIPNVPNAPVLVSPANGVTGQPVNMTFVWRKAVETLLTMSKSPQNKNKKIPFDDDILTLNKYWLEYTSTDSTFATGVIRDSSATDTTKSVTLSYNTKYWWRVKGKNQTGWGSFSAVWSFTTILPVPIAPVLLLPVNNAAGVSLTPLLDWSDVATAASYRIQVSSDSIFAATMFDTSGVTVSQLTIPAGKLTGLTKYYWRVNATNINGTSPWSTIWNFRTLQNLTLNLKVYLEGFWTGTIQKQDTVVVYLAGALTPYAFSDSAKVFLSPDGTALITFTKAPNANYYIVVQHRNHLQTWSKLAQSFTTNVAVNYDFTTAATQAYGDNMKLDGSVWVLFVGDANQDGSIDAADVTDFFIPQYGNTGYLSCDFNCDGSVDAEDVPYMIANYGLTKVAPPLEIGPSENRKQKSMILQDELNYLFKLNKIKNPNSKFIEK